MADSNIQDTKSVDCGALPPRERGSSNMTKASEARCPTCGTEFVGRLEVAERLGVSINTVDSWRTPKPGRRPIDPPFPTEAFRISPGGNYAGVPIWDWGSVEDWAEKAGKRKG